MSLYKEKISKIIDQDKKRIKKALDLIDEESVFAKNCSLFNKKYFSLIFSFIESINPYEGKIHLNINLENISINKSLFDSNKDLEVEEAKKNYIKYLVFLESQILGKSLKNKISAISEKESQDGAVQTKSEIDEVFFIQSYIISMEVLRFILERIEKYLGDEKEKIIQILREILHLETGQEFSFEQHFKDVKEAFHDKYSGAKLILEQFMPESKLP